MFGTNQTCIKRVVSYAVVLLWIAGCTANDNGGDSVRAAYHDIPATPDCLQNIDETLENADADLLFSYDHVPVFDIFMPPERWENLRANARDEEWVEGDVCFEGAAIGQIGVRFKGNVGTLYSCFDENDRLTCPRLSLKFKFSEYDDDKRFYGLKRLNLQAYRWDGTKMREKLAYDVFKDMGITAPRALWAVVRVNGETTGVYGMVEAIDGRFTEDRWPDSPDGNLYKEVWPTDTDTSYIVERLKTNEEDADVSDLLSLASEINGAVDSQAVLQVLNSHLNVDEWMRFLAVEDAITSWDGLTFFYTGDGGLHHNHNYYLYGDAPGHFELIPWDLDGTFWIKDPHEPPHWTEQQDDCSQTYMYWDWIGVRAIAPACDTIMAALHLKLSVWKQAASEALNGPISAETMDARIGAYIQFMGKEAREPQTYAGGFNREVGYLRDELARIRNLLSQRIQ
jgi:spore coat protein H